MTVQPLPLRRASSADPLDHRGEALAAADAHRVQPVAHLGARSSHSDHPLFLSGDDYLDRGAVFGVKESLVVDVLDHAPGQADDGTEVDGPWHSIIVDITLATDTS
jgi:hydroxyquinol 1,2-dioxygenase